MKIISQNYAIFSNNTPQNKQNVACKAVYAKSPLKNIPGNHCACCGRAMINAETMANTWANITRPIKEVFADGLFSVIESKYPGIYSVLCKFLDLYPDKSLDSIILDNYNHALFMDSVSASFDDDPDYQEMPRVDKHRAVKERTMDVFKLSERVLLNAPEVIKHLKLLRPYMHDYRMDILDELDRLSQIYPDKKLSEIIKIPEVAEKYVENNYYDVMEFAKQRDLHWNNANRIILNEKPELESVLDEIHTKICLLYRSENDPKRLSYIIQQMYIKLLEKSKLQHCKESVIKELEQIPTELYTKNSFLSYARRYYTNCGIVNYIIKPFMESEDHEVAVTKIKSIDTTNPLWKKYHAIINKLIMCRQCNIFKDSHSFEEVAKYRPEIIPNTENQIDFVAEQILNDVVTDTIFYYPVEAAEWLRMYTHGTVNHDTTWYQERIAKKYGYNSYQEFRDSLNNH